MESRLESKHGASCETVKRPTCKSDKGLDQSGRQGGRGRLGECFARNKINRAWDIRNEG